MEFLRKFAKSRLGQFSMLIILAPMAFLGLNGLGGGSQARDEVIRIGDTSIGLNQLQSSINDQRKLLVANGIEASLINEDVLQAQVIKNLINRVLLEQQTQKLGYTVSDAFITRELKSYPVFQDAEGKFSNEQFANVLQRQGLTKDQLFAQRRSELAMQQLTNGILNTAIYPLTTIDAIINQQLESKEVWLYRLPWQTFQDKITVNEHQIKEYYDQHRDELKSIPMVDLSYIRLTPDDITVDDISDEELQQQYEIYKQDNNLMDMRQLSQILLTGDDAEAKAEEIQAQLKEGVDFTQLVKQYSEDLTAEDGGAIGRFNPAMFNDDAKAVEDALMGLSVGDVSAPVKTSFGVQIFKVMADEADSIPTLDSLKDELSKKAQDYKKQTLFNDKVAKINTLAIDGYGLQDIAEQEGLTVQTIKNYQKENNLSDLAQPAVIEKAFDEFMIQDQSVSSDIDLDTARVWLQSANYRPTDVMSLEVATPIIKNLLIQQKATDLAYEQATKLAKVVKSKEDLVVNEQKKTDKTAQKTTQKAQKDAEQPQVVTEAEGQTKVNYVPLGVINRQYPLLDSSEIQVAFSEDTKGLVAKATKTATGASIVVSEMVADDNSQKISDSERKQIAKTIRESFGQNQLADYLDYLNSSAKIKINQDKINNAEGL